MNLAVSDSIEFKFLTNCTAWNPSSLPGTSFTPLSGVGVGPHTDLQRGKLSSKKVRSSSEAHGGLFKLLWEKEQWG